MSNNLEKKHHLSSAFVPNLAQSKFTANSNIKYPHLRQNSYKMMTAQPKERFSSQTEP